MSEQKGNYNLEQLKRENAALRKYAAIQKATEETIGCQKIYVDIAGGISEAFVLDELIFFTLPRPETGKSGLRVWKDGVLWMAVSRSEWWERKRLTAKEADGAIARLLNRKLIFKDHFLFNKQKTTHLRLNIPLFFKLYSEFLEKQDPPEDDSNTTQRDISDLYTMMGMTDEDTPQGIPDGEQGIPVKDTPSLNGDSINSPNTSSTHPPRKKRGASAKPKPTQPPEILLYREVVEHYPKKPQREIVIEAIQKIGKRLGHPATKEDLSPFWKHWATVSGNEWSLVWLVDWAVRGFIPNGKQSNTPAAPVAATLANWLAQKEAQNGRTA
jgi:hypothetical protein